MGGKGYRHTQTQTDTQRHTKCSLRGLTRETLFFPACLRVGQTLAAHSRGQLRVRHEAVRTQLSETSKAPQQDLPVTTNMLSETGTSSIRVLGAHSAVTFGRAGSTTSSGAADAALGNHVFIFRIHSCFLISVHVGPPF